MEDKTYPIHSSKVIIDGIKKRVNKPSAEQRLRDFPFEEAIEKTKEEIKNLKRDLVVQRKMAEISHWSYSVNVHRSIIEQLTRELDILIKLKELQVAA